MWQDDIGHTWMAFALTGSPIKYLEYTQTRKDERETRRYVNGNNKSKGIGA
jgi:hypothetical protein